MSDRNKLPPLPGKYRNAEIQAPLEEDHGFRWGAFALSAGFLFVGVFTLLTSTPFDDVALTGAAAILIVSAVVSGVASRGWSDRPIEGVQRFFANVPFMVLGCVAVGGVGFLLYGGALVLGKVLADDPLGLAVAILLSLGVLVVMYWLGVADLMRVSIASYLHTNNKGIVDMPTASEDHGPTFLQVERRARFFWDRNR